jgi:hypothetical protein
MAKRTNNEFLKINLQQRTPYQVDNTGVGGVVYIRYASGTGKCLIIKTAESGTVTTMSKTWDTWTNRVAATYVDIDKPLTVED